MQQVAWQKEVFRIIAITAIGFITGLSFDQPFWGVLVGLIVSHIVILHNLRKMFLWANDQGPAPQDNGLVGFSVDRFIRREQTLKDKNKFQKKQLVRIFRGIESLQDGVLITDRQGNISTFNKSAALLLGLREESDTGSYLTNLIRSPKFVKYFDKGNFKKPFELPAPHNINRMVQIQITKFGIDQKIAIIRDITDRQRLENMRQSFIADASHELRTPLTVINGYLEVLNTGELPAPVNRALNSMTAQANRMKTLVNDLIELSKLESVNQDRLGTHFDLKLLCAEAIDAVQGYNESQCQVKFSCPDNLQILGFEKEMSSVLTNLLTNAIKYGAADGDIELDVVRSDYGVEISVTDHGDGIAPKHLSRLTERFYRVDDSRESTTGGSGLGLAITKYALEHHNSELMIESTVGQGSSFSFILPAERVQ